MLKKQKTMPENIKKIKRIGVFTSGGDAPGMNACIRAVVRACDYYGIEPVGIMEGYRGMIRGDFKVLNSRSVAYILDRGGTILRSARSDEFRTPEGRYQAREHLKEWFIDAIVAIGGDGTFTGANLLHKEFGIPVIGIPGTIDNDLNGTDFTLGYDTATNTAVEAIDKIRDTASSHNRLFFVEVMGRDAGFIAARCGLAVGAIAILIPEREMSVEKLVEKLEEGARARKKSNLVIVAEGGKSGSAIEIAEKVKQKFSYYDTRVTILGHLQRGGSPTCFDRELACRFGVAAVEGLMAGKEDMMVGIVNNKIKYTSLDKAVKEGPEIDEEILRIADILSR